VVGKALIGLYLGRSNVASGYGAAGSIITLLLWVYYSSLILLYGAEFTKVYAESRGSRRGRARNHGQHPASRRPATSPSE
jgi:membrane protein